MWWTDVAETPQARVILCDGAPTLSPVPNSSDRAWCRPASRDVAYTFASHCRVNVGNSLRTIFCDMHTAFVPALSVCGWVREVSLFVLDQVELHAEVVDLARQHFDFGLADDAQTTVTVQVGDGRDVLEQSPPSAYDLVMVDLSVAGFVDEQACSHLRRVLRPGGVCVHNYNFASGQEISDVLPATFTQVHQLVIDANNTILVSTTAEIRGDDDFNTLIDKAAAVPYASPLTFDLRAVSSTILRLHRTSKHSESNALGAYRLR
jgi:SAM-dependent methyltransferase